MSGILSLPKTLLSTWFSAVANVVLFWPRLCLRLKDGAMRAIYAQSMQDKVVLITGASSGIGRALAFELYSAGCKLILASRNVDKLNQLKEELVGGAAAAQRGEGQQGQSQQGQSQQGQSQQGQSQQGLRQQGDGQQVEGQQGDGQQDDGQQGEGQQAESQQGEGQQVDRDGESDGLREGAGMPRLNPPDGRHLPSVLALDLTKGEVEIGEAAERAMALFGKIDVLVNNGGISMRGAVQDTALSVHRAVMETNYFGMVALTKALLPGMTSNKSGRVVNVSSLQGLFAVPNRAAYSSSKHAVQAFSDSLRAEVTSAGVGVTVVSPGYVKTEISKNALTGAGAIHGVMDKTQERGYPPEMVAVAIRDAIEMGRDEVTVAPLHHCAAKYLRHLLPWAFFKYMAFIAVDVSDKKED